MNLVKQMNLELKTVDGKFNTYMIKKFNDELGGVHYIFRFPNNYGASVIKGKYTYGGSEDLWEMALIFCFDEDGHWDLVYERDFDEDVIGYLTDEQVNELLGKILEY